MKNHPEGMLWCGLGQHLKVGQGIFDFLGKYSCPTSTSPQSYMKSFINHFIHISFHLTLQVWTPSGIYGKTCGFSRCKRLVLGWRYSHRGWLDTWGSSTGSWLRWHGDKGKANIGFLIFFPCRERASLITFNLHLFSICPLPWARLCTRLWG